MNLTNFDWKNNYNSFIDYLYSFQDIKYKEFHSKLILDNNIIGIRMPVLKKIAKEISKNDYNSFLKYNHLEIYEEKMIYGLVLGYLKINFKELLDLLDSFIPYIDNWAICDCLCANLKIFKVNQKEGYKYIFKCLKSKDSFKIRVGIVLLLDFYINDDYIDKILIELEKIKNDNYYVKMAIAWCISMCYIKYQDKTHNFLIKADLDEFVFNKSISKICDSYRIGKDTKNEIRKLKK